MVSVGVSQLRLVSGWAELWWLPLHPGLKQTAAAAAASPAAFRRLLFMVLFIQPLCASQPQETKKNRTTTFIATLKKKT